MKTLTLENETWKRLAQLKLDKGLKSMNKLILYLLKKGEI